MIHGLEQIDYEAYEPDFETVAKADREEPFAEAAFELLKDPQPPTPSGRTPPASMPAGDHLSQAHSVPPKHGRLDNQPAFIEANRRSRRARARTPASPTSRYSARRVATRPRSFR
jgi:hypothetical protein